MTNAAANSRTSVLARVAAVLLAANALRCEANAETIESRLLAPASVRWDGAPLGPTLARFSDAFSTPVWLDRRVDPTRELRLTAQDATVASILNQTAKAAGTEATPFAGTVYIGPPRSAAAIGGLALDASSKANPVLRRRGVTEWPRLATARDVIASIAAEAGVDLVNPDAIPLDVWDAGQTPSLSVGDRLTLLLIGFDLRWRSVSGAGRTIAVTPINYDEVALAPPLVARGAARPSPPDRLERRYTLRVREQSLRAILRQLAPQLGMTLSLAPELSAGEDPRVSFDVRGATLAELLAAVGDAGGVLLEAEGDRLIARPRD